MRFLHVLLFLACCNPARAQDAPPTPPPIEYTTVAAALKALEARDGNGTIVVHSEGWTIVHEPMAAMQWSFTPPGHGAHPAVVRRIIRRAPGGAVSVDTKLLCEAAAAECDKLQAEFLAMNDRITQAVKARGRQGSTPPAR